MVESKMQSEPLLMGKSHVFHHNLPYVAHKRLVHYTHMPAPTPHNSVRNSVIANELDRIQNRSRPHFSHVPTEDYLNSRSVVNFDDDVRNIRAHTAALLKRVQAPIPRAARMPLSSAFDHIETAIPDRIISDAYISTMLSPRNNVERVVQKMCQYPEINEKAYHNIGRGRLACVSFAGGKSYPRRRHIMVSGNGSEETRNVKADIEMLSYYNKARNGAAEIATHEVPLYTNFRRSPEPYTPRSYYRLIRPYKPTKSAPAKVEVQRENVDVGEEETPRRSKKSLSRQATLEKEQEEAARREAEEAIRREQEEEAKVIAAEIEREEAEREEKARLAKAARLAEQKAEEERIAKEKEEEERLLAEIAEQERIAAEKEEEERLAAEALEQERLEAEQVKKAEEERLAAEEEEERQRLEAERIEEERLEEERIEAEREAEEERISAAQAQEERYAQDQGRMDEERLAAELAENLLRIKAERDREEQEEEESEKDCATTEEPEENRQEDEYVSDEDNDKAVAESSEDEEETKDELGDEGHPIVEYPVTPDVTGHEKKSLLAAEEVGTTSEEEEEE